MKPKSKKRPLTREQEAEAVRVRTQLRQIAGFLCGSDDANRKHVTQWLPHTHGTPVAGMMADQLIGRLRERGGAVAPRIAAGLVALGPVAVFRVRRAIPRARRTPGRRARLYEVLAAVADTAAPIDRMAILAELLDGQNDPVAEVREACERLVDRFTPASAFA